MNTRKPVCTHCHCSDVQFNTHHILPRSDGGADNAANTQLLCAACHKALHSQRGDFARWGKRGGESTQARFDNWRRCWRNLRQFKSMTDQQFERYLLARVVMVGTD